MFSSVVTVCTGNICRSPLAEYLFRSRLERVSAKVSSAGIQALVNQPADVLAQEIAQTHGLDLSPHLGRQVEKSVLEEHELVLVMEDHHRDYIRSRFPQVSGKVFLLGKWEEEMQIPDPYKKSPDFFKEVYSQIDRSVAHWVNRMNGAD